MSLDKFVNANEAINAINSFRSDGSSAFHNSVNDLANKYIDKINLGLDFNRMYFLFYTNLCSLYKVYQTKYFSTYGIPSFFADNLVITNCSDYLSQVSLPRFIILEDLRNVVRSVNNNEFYDYYKIKIEERMIEVKKEITQKCSSREEYNEMILSFSNEIHGMLEDAKNMNGYHFKADEAFEQSDLQVFLPLEGGLVSIGRVYSDGLIYHNVEGIEDYKYTEFTKKFCKLSLALAAMFEFDNPLWNHVYYIQNIGLLCKNEDGHWAVIKNGDFLLNDYGSFHRIKQDKKIHVYKNIYIDVYNRVSSNRKQDVEVAKAL